MRFIRGTTAYFLARIRLSSRLNQHGSERVILASTRECQVFNNSYKGSYARIKENTPFGVARGVIHLCTHHLWVHESIC